MRRRVLPAMIALGGLALTCTAHAQYNTPPPDTLDCQLLNCSEVLPGAVRFERASGQRYATGYDQADAVVGWVVLSTDIVEVKAYSGHPLVTLVGLDPEGVITGAKVVHHSEPILLVGIPESALHNFVAHYVGLRADTRVVVGRSAAEGVVSVDAISGATVTALAQNQTILEASRALGAAVSVIDIAALRPGHFVTEDELWSWDRMVREGIFGRLTITEADMGLEGSQETFVDLWFTLADAPQIGRSLIGDGDYEYLVSKLEPGQHLLVVLGNGKTSFKGSAFVRGGIFDRVRVDQGLIEVVFRDTDYHNLTPVRAEGAPSFREGAVFTTRGGRIDPGVPFDLVFLGSRYDRRGGFSREFREFRGTLHLPESVYVFDGPDPNEPLWHQAWRNNALDAAALLEMLEAHGVALD